MQVIVGRQDMPFSRADVRYLADQEEIQTFLKSHVHKLIQPPQLNQHQHEQEQHQQDSSASRTTASQPHLDTETNGSVAGDVGESPPMDGLELVSLHQPNASSMDASWQAERESRLETAALCAAAASSQSWQEYEYAIAR